MTQTASSLAIRDIGDVADIAGALRDRFECIADPARLAGLDDGQLVALVRSAEQLGRIIDGVRVVAAGETAERSRPTLGGASLAVRYGCRNGSELLERVALVSGATARARMRTGAGIRHELALAGDVLPGVFPLVRHAVASGTMSTDAADAIVRELAPIRDRGADPNAVAAAEAELVAAATGTGTVARAPGSAVPATPDEIRIMAQTWAIVLDPDGPAPDEQKGMRRRGLSIGRLRDGTRPVRGDLLPDVAAQFERLLDAYLNPRTDAGPRFRGDLEDGEDLGPEPVADRERRSSAQKRHDALAGILAVAAKHADTPALGGAAPTLVVAVTPDQLARHDGVAFVQGTDPIHAPVPVHVAHQTGCAGAIQRVLLDGNGRILRLGTPDRVFNAHQRRAIALRDGGCIVPGCHVPATWCEVHHVDAAADGGPTHADNGVLLCWWHHRTIDTGGWEIRMRGGVPWIRSPGWIDPRRTWTPARASPLRDWQRHRG